MDSESVKARGLGGRGLPLTLCAVAIAFAVDRLVKWWIVEAMDLRERLFAEVLPPYLNLVMAWNRGANFGLGDTLGRGFWIALALLVSAALIWWSLRMTDPLRRACVGILVGGALGNALDRAIYGAVADFLNMSCCGIRNPYAFNPADIFIFVGALGLILRDGSDNQSA